MKFKYTSVTLSPKTKKQIEEIKTAYLVDGLIPPNQNMIIEMGIDSIHKEKVRGGNDETL